MFSVECFVLSVQRLGFRVSCFVLSVECLGIRDWVEGVGLRVQGRVSCLVFSA